MPDAPAQPLVRGCPKCATRFRIAPELLEVANGQVRCGACLTVFDGRVEEARTPPAGEPATGEPLPEPTAPATLEAPPQRAEQAPPEKPEHPAPADPVPQEPFPNVPQPEQTPNAEEPQPAITPIRMGARTMLRAKADKPKRSHRATDAGGKAGTARLALGVLLALVALAVNVFGMRFEEWSRLAQMRPLYEHVCAAIGCRVRAPKDLDAWAFATKDVTRLGYPEPIVVTAELVNNAAYGQRLPTVLARFTSADGETLREERLRPRDYLPERSSQRLAPSKSATVELRFADPGYEAVRHTILLL